MKRLLTIILTTAALLAATQAAQAATYSVKLDGTGDFTTIQACADAAQTGDTCVIQDGIYDERIQLTRSGAYDKPIRLVAAPNADVRIQFISFDDLLTKDHLAGIVPEVDALYADLINNGYIDDQGILQLKARLAMDYPDIVLTGTYTWQQRRAVAQALRKAEEGAHHIHLEGIKTRELYQHGVTWIFDQYYQFGLFANGDYWVLGPVTITAMIPEWDGTQNGWEINPTVQWPQGFVGGLSSYNEALRPAMPFTMNSGSLVKTIGNNHATTSYIKTAAVLTVLTEAPPGDGAGVFRPPYVGIDKPLFLVSNLRRDLLPSYAPVGTPPSLATVQANFSKGLRMDHHYNVSRWFRPSDAMANYQPGNTVTLNEAMLRLMLNDSYESKLPALTQFTQHTIDQAYAVLYGYRLLDDGHNPNHRILAGWAAALLNIQPVKDVLMNESTIMHEDHFVLKPGTVALWGDPTGSYSSIESSYWNYIMTGSGSKSTKDPYGHIDGGKLGPSGASYQNITVQSHKGEVLATLLMPALNVSWRPSQWPVMVEYVDRWVNHGVWALPDPCAPYDGIPENYGKTFGPDPNNPGKCILGSGRFPQYHGANKDGGQYRSPFVAAMWAAYRNYILYGDVSGDGAVTAYDAALALQLDKTELEAGQIAQRAVKY